MSHRTPICLARHGQTDWNATGRLQGWCDVSLNHTGREQAAQLARQLADTGFLAVWSSPLQRARQTAEIIVEQLGLPAPRLHEGLKERHFGIFQGMTKDALAQSHPALLAHISQRNPAAEFTGGENMHMFAGRVLATLAEIAAQPGPLLVVSHGWVLDVAARQQRGLSTEALLGTKPGNGECLWLERPVWAEAEAV
ncbi:MAG: histidine phosphatase family protein [Sterolibacterium sp.]|nr:histidine phosphatase family protein [Sterolibacterium sp.]